MHISDGVLSALVVAAGWAVTLLIILAVLAKIKESDIVEEIPKISVMTAAFFVASLIHIPIGPTSVHPMLGGLMGIMLGPIAYISIFVGLILQALLFQHGGVTTIGINAVLVGIPALLAFYVFKRGHEKGMSEKFLGVLCGGFAVALSALLLVLSLISTGQEFLGLARIAALAHIPLIILEGILTGLIVAYLTTVKPELLPVKKKR